MGTPQFAVASLKALVESNQEVVGVVTAPDRPAGRGRSLKQSAVKQYALSQDLPVLQPTNLKDETFINTLKSLQATLFVVVAFRMLPKVVWQLPKHGTFNLHASLLPHYRGAAPINWALINGETKTGVTTFFIDEKIDTGDLILQEETPITPEDTAGSLHDKLMQLGSELVAQTVQQISKNNLKTIPQKDVKNIKPAPKLNPENTKIDWTDSAVSIYNKIRGLSPYPTAWCHLNNGTEQIKIKIYRATYKKEAHSSPIGKIIPTKKTIQVATHDGYVFIQELQLPGKKQMEVSAFLNGFHFEKNANLG